MDWEVPFSSAVAVELPAMILSMLSETLVPKSCAGDGGSPLSRPWFKLWFSLLSASEGFAALLLASFAATAAAVRRSLLARFCFGNELVILELVAVIKLLLAAFKIGVGKALNILWLVGMAFVGGSGVWALAPKTDI